jgi:DNA polymerase
VNFVDSTAKAKWQRHRRKWAHCVACPLGVAATEHVFARGDLPASVFFVGEAPGETEDIVGEPFRGDAGDMFEKLLAATRVWLKRDFSYVITNILCCRPTLFDKGRLQNRAPEKTEAAACSPRLYEFFKIADPDCIVTMGKTASKFFPEKSLPRLEITHPSYWLRTGREHGLEFKRALVHLRKFIKEHA